MTEDDIGFVCICGKRIDKNGKDITPEQIDPMKEEATRIEKRKAFRFKYPNMNDSFTRIAPVIIENDTIDETNSDIPPSKKDKKNK
ncbi:MAG: hypothetical protein K0S55_1601 [Clostridia bacterium]|nr:hypothetical protein [Clostridia bacterium]